MDKRDMAQHNGDCTDNGITYILTQQAYISGTNEHPYYTAMAIREDSTGDIVDAYEIRWEIINPDAEDESDACNWDAPYSIKRSGGYDLTDNRHI